MKSNDYCNGALVIFLVACLVQAPVAVAFIMGSDDRSELTAAESRTPAIRQVGRIDIPDGGFVSGLVTGSNCDVVITAGHAAYYVEDSINGDRSRGAARGNGIFRFYPEPGTDEFIVMELVSSGFQNTGQAGLDIHDWSIFRLQRPAYRDCAKIEYKSGGSGCAGGLLMPAIHFDRRNTRLVDRTCEIKDVMEGRIVVHDCDSKDGSSGAPLLCNTDTGIFVLGINISGVSQRELVDPGEYGQDSKQFDYRNHKNFALNIEGEFLDALEKELRLSLKRKATVLEGN